jgi:Ribbon-helix-helix protein, copG family
MMPPRKMKSNGVPTRTRLSNGNGTLNGSASLTRTTIFLPDEMDQNLDCLALMTGESKATIVRLALAKYMKETYGYDPYKKPKITVSHR